MSTRAPASGADGGGRAFYGRDWVWTKLGQIVDARSAASAASTASAPGGVLLVGGPGAGKTALCVQLVRPAAPTGGGRLAALSGRVLAHHIVDDVAAAVFTAKTGYVIEAQPCPPINFAPHHRMTAAVAMNPIRSPFFK